MDKSILFISLKIKEAVSNGKCFDSDFNLIEVRGSYRLTALHCLLI